MYGLNAFALVMFCCINVLSARLCRCSDTARRKTLRILCLILLSGNALRCALSPLIGHGLRIPVEFSTVAYFTVPAVLLLSLKRLRSWAAYSGLMAGFFYYMTMIIAGGAIYNDYPPLEVYVSMFCHGTVYLCGFVTVGTERCGEEDTRSLILGLACVGIRAVLLRPLVDTPERLFIYKLLDAACIKQFLPPGSWGAALPLYYVTLGALLALSTVGFFKISRLSFGKFSAPAGK